MRRAGFDDSSILDKLGMTISDFDLVEHNEAFAVSSILFARKFEIPSEKLNVHGGAIIEAFY